MKGSRAVILLVLSLVAGLAAVVLAGRWLTQQASSKSEFVAVAKRDVDLGEPLNANLVEMMPWPTGAIPKGAFHDLKLLEGRVIVMPLQRGEPILETKLAPVGTKGGLSAVIPGGKRAISVKVNEVVGVAGFALPGNFVDVMVNTEDDDKRPISKIVLERILVLAIAQVANRDETKPKVVSAVTLEVTPEQAERLDLARSVGNLSLVLRNQIDQNPTLTAGARKDELLGKRAPPPPQAIAAPVARVSSPAPRRVAKAEAKPTPPEQPPTVEVIRGVQRSAVQQQ